MSHFDTFNTALSQMTDHRGILGDEFIEYPPSESYDYWATPTNAVVFGCMGCDGVHYAILKIDREICDHSPVIQISPMDFDEPYTLLAPTFIKYLAIGCGTPTDQIEGILKREREGEAILIDYLRLHFDQSRFWSDTVDHNIAPYLPLIQTSNNEP